VIHNLVSNTASQNKRIRVNMALGFPGSECNNSLREKNTSVSHFQTHFRKTQHDKYGSGTIA
jgi:hypothetical protein